MANWYCNGGDGSTTGYWGVASWVANTVYPTGSIVRQTSPAVGSERCYINLGSEFTSHATTEPTWPTVEKAQTVADNGGTWTECTGNETYQGTSGVWAAPHARLNSARAWCGARDTIYVASVHTETKSAESRLNGATNEHEMYYALCVTQNENVPPLFADRTTGAVVATSGANGFLFYPGGFYFEGITFKAGSGFSASFINLSGSSVGYRVFRNCELHIVTSHATSYINAGQEAGTVLLHDCSVKFAAVTQGMTYGRGNFFWSNSTYPALAAGSSVPTSLFITGTPTTRSGFCSLENLDLSAISGTLFTRDTTYADWLALSRCRLHASVTVTNTPVYWDGDVHLTHCANGTDYTQMSRYAKQATQIDDPLCVRTGGAPMSWKITTNATATNVPWHFPYVSPPLCVLNTVVGSPVTLTVHGVVATTLPENDELWAECIYLGDAASTLGTLLSSTVANFGDASSTLDADASAEWTGANVPGSPQKFKITLTFTPQAAGWIAVKIKAAKNNVEYFIDPLVEQS